MSCHCQCITGIYSSWCGGGCQVSCAAWTGGLDSTAFVNERRMQDYQGTHVQSHMRRGATPICFNGLPIIYLKTRKISICCACACKTSRPFFRAAIISTEGSTAHAHAVVRVHGYAPFDNFCQDWRAQKMALLFSHVGILQKSWLVC